MRRRASGPPFLLGTFLVIERSASRKLVVVNLAQHIAAAYAAFAAGRYDEAEGRAQRVLNQSPKEPGALTLKGRLALAAGEPDVAHDIFRNLLQAHANIPALWVDLALALRDLNYPEKAREALQQAIALDSRDSAYWVRLGEIQLSLNERESASQSFRRALEFDPHSVPAFRGVAQAESLQPEDALVSRFENLAARKQVAPGLQAHLHYTLAQIFKRACLNQAFIEHLFAANAYQRAACESDAMSRYREMFDRIESVFEHVQFGRLKRAKAISPTPLFILGMPRSGTTLVERLLAAHPQVAAGGEIDYMRRILRRSVERHTRQPFPEGFSSLQPQIVDDLAESFGRRLQILSRGAPFVTDKTPGNYHLLGLLRVLFPAGHIVHVEREPMDNCFSILQYPFDERSPHTCDVELLAYSYARYRSLMRRWQDLIGGEFLTVRYEDLVTAPLTYAPRLYAHCGLEWRDEYLEPAAASAPVRTFSVMQVREPIYSSSVGAWRTFEEQLAPLRSALDRALEEGKG